MITFHLEGENDLKGILRLTLVVTATILGVVACRPAPDANRNAATTANSNGNSNVAIGSTPSPSLSQSPTASPIEVLTAWQEAINKGNIAAYMKTLSKLSVKQIEDGAKENNVTTDQYIKTSGDMRLFRNLFPMPLKILKEIPEGDQMTYHIKDSRGLLHWATLMKEQGEWKVDQWATTMVMD